MDSMKRTIAKTISWRVFAVTITSILLLIVTGSLALAFSVGILDMVIKTILYFCHERIWAKKINWFKKPKKEATTENLRKKVLKKGTWKPKIILDKGRHAAFAESAGGVSIFVGSFNDKDEALRQAQDQCLLESLNIEVDDAA
jgi:uncharacterized membrane protein